MTLLCLSKKNMKMLDVDNLKKIFLSVEFNIIIYI